MDIYSPDQLATQRALLINGLPGSGKSMLGELLKGRLNAPLLSLDTIKEELFDTIGTGDREYNRMLSRASLKVIWAVIGSMPPRSFVMVDAYFGFPPYDRVITGLKRAGVQRVAEIFCFASGETLAQRYLARVDQRHPGHLGKEYAPELAEAANHIRPMGLCPNLSVDTNDPTDINLDTIVQWVENQLGLSNNSYSE